MSADQPDDDGPPSSPPFFDGAPLTDDERFKLLNPYADELTPAIQTLRDFGWTDAHGAHHDGPRLAPPAEETPSSAIASAWRPLDLAMLTTPPPSCRWLIRHPTRDGQPCAPAAGDGMFPLGKVGLLVADGGIGKTLAVFGLAVSIITGRKWFDHFEIGYEARKGRVLLALAEEDRDEVHRRLYAVTQAYKLTPEERARVVDRLVVLPLAGKVVSLLRYALDGRTLIESDELIALREHLRDHAGEDGWSLIVPDPLARWGSEETETDNAIATRNVQALETLVEAPGGPAILVPHHTSMAGAQTNNVRSRGATGIRNGARWEAALWEEGADVFFRQTKSNYSRPMRDPLRLVRGSGGLLRVASAGEEQERQERTKEKQNAKTAEKDAATDARERQRNEALRERLLSAIRQHAGTEGVRGADAACKLAEVKPASGRPLVAALLTQGAIVDRPVKGKPRLFPAPEAPPTPAGEPSAPC